ncbi:hypothetical protein T01_8599 [Trichinella spiralis]|uniref:Uncharacterized protein n=1 Tax=Trichinella spiralis TaxID=6334 RepID=A0A0V0YTB3_TRISP|nr:hypothetical protein T01_8599 [Trichinella spiralis]
MGSHLPLLFSGHRVLQLDDCLRLPSTTSIVPLYLLTVTILPDPS